MTPLLITSLLSYGTPLLIVAALMLLVPAALAAPSRLVAAGTLLGALLCTAALVLVGINPLLPMHFTATDGAIATLFLLATGLTIAPMADRARPASLMLIAPLAAYAVLTALFMFNVSSSLLLLTSIITSTIIALIGSALLPSHPARYTVSGQLRDYATSQAALLIGWVLLATSFIALSALVGISVDLTLVMLAAIIAALATLLTTRAQDGLAKAGEAMAAAILLTTCIPLTLQLTVLLALTAAFFVNRSEAISSSLRVDDPHHFIGAMLLPAIFGLIFPGMLDTAYLASQLRWLGVALVIGIALAALLWPVVMLFTGLALPKRRVAQGIRA